MSSFTHALVITAYGHPEKFEVISEFKYYHGHIGSDQWTVVPEGFKTNLLSIPQWILWGLLKLFPWLEASLYVANQAAVLHDWLYGHAWVNTSTGKKEISRKFADQAFNEAMKVLGVIPWVRRVLYFGIRMFGWYRWWQLNSE